MKFLNNLYLTEILFKMTEPIVEISDGKLRGKFEKSFDGEQIYAFLGIPYGKPPVGELRFKVLVKDNSNIV